MEMKEKYTTNTLEYAEAVNVAEIKSFINEWVNRVAESKQ